MQIKGKVTGNPVNQFASKKNGKQYQKFAMLTSDGQVYFVMSGVIVEGLKAGESVVIDMRIPDQIFADSVVRV